MTKEELRSITGGCGENSKMPGTTYGISTRYCVPDPAPGTVCARCYARKGFYLMPTVKAAHERREQAMELARSNDTDRFAWVCAMAAEIGQGRVPYHRWYDSGDLSCWEDLAMIADVARAAPRVKHWLPSKKYSIVIDYLQRETPPRNLTIRLSAMLVNDALRWARDRGLVTSSVFTSTPPRGARVCPADRQGHNCGDCRACWDKRVKHVAYRLR